MSWGKEWPIEQLKPRSQWDKDVAGLDWPKAASIEKAKAEEFKIIKDTFQNIGEKVYNNLPPTHDPYTNPNAHIYYQCNCGAILDPGTKSFAELNNQASRQGWKIRFSDTGYKPYCVKCGKGVE